MEGKFSRTKKPTHPHTNMAKAALNMMTRTSADDWAKQGIYMNSIDTGWITCALSSSFFLLLVINRSSFLLVSSTLSLPMTSELFL